MHEHIPLNLEECKEMIFEETITSMPFKFVGKIYDGEVVQAVFFSRKKKHSLSTRVSFE